MHASCVAAGWPRTPDVRLRTNVVSESPGSTERVAYESAKLVRGWKSAIVSNSSMDEDQPFHHPEADAALFEALREGLAGTQVELVERENNINDEEFALAMADKLDGYLGGGR